MGAASCKNSQVAEQSISVKSISIGVFGLDNAGKTSIVKAIAGAPSDDVSPTEGSSITRVGHPKAVRNDKKPIQIIDVGGDRDSIRQNWPKIYDQVHGWIFVIDTTNRRRWRTNQETLEDLFDQHKLKDKPVIIFANKKDRSDAVNNEKDLKSKLDLQQWPMKSKLEFCSALPQNDKNRVDPAIPRGFTWLIQTIEGNYSKLNSQLTKTPTGSRKQNFSDQSESDENQRAIRNNRLPSIRKKPVGTMHDDDDDEDVRVNSKSNQSSLKKKKVLGSTDENYPVKKTSTNQYPTPYRSPFEPLPEETPWTTSSANRKFDDTFPKLTSKSSLSSRTRTRDVSPLVHDTKPTGYRSASRLTYGSDDETGRFNADRFDYSSTTKKSTTFGSYGNDDYSRTNKVAKTNHGYDSDDDKTTQRYTNGGYRSASTKPTTTNRTRFEDDDYTSTKPKTKSYFDDDDDDDDRPSYSTASHSAGWSKKTYDDYPTRNTRSHFDDDDYSPAKSRFRSHEN